MEDFLGFLGIIAVIFGVNLVINVFAKGAHLAGRAAKKAITGKETYVGPAQFKLEEEAVPDSELTLKKVMFRGEMPNLLTMNLSFMLSALDSTEGDGNWKPVLSFIDTAQEPETICFQQTGEFGRVGEHAGFTDWVRLGAISPQLIQPPHSGARTIALVIRFFDTANPPNVYGGQHDNDDAGIIYTALLEFNHYFTDKGYEEEVQHREESQVISLKIAVAVAMADGSLDDAEGDVLKKWITKEIAPFRDEKKDHLRTLFNGALKEAFQQAKAGDLILTPLVERLHSIGEKKTKYDAVELCLDVMAADGVADPEEMTLIRNVAKALELDMTELEKMREKVTLDLSTELTTEAGLESLVGIDPSWTNDEKRRHLRAEFQKWSNRLNSLPAGEQRIAAQNMLDTIAELRKRYG